MRVETRYGLVDGTTEGSVKVFRGIPYAEPPVGPRRFQPPVPPKPWSNVLVAHKFGPMALQPTGATLLPRAAMGQSENCLTLNIWTPGLDEARRPVLVWIHGGGFTTGSGADPYSQGRNFATDGDVVFVSVNYRLGAFGFLYLGDLLGEAYASSGNCGILDIVAALRWVQENIANFGGDPSRVSVGGVSAGAKCVASLFSVPAAEPLFQQAILQSGAAQAIRSQQTASSVTRQLLKQLGLATTQAHQLLTLPASVILSAQERLGLGIKNLHLFGPVLDRATLLYPPTGVMQSTGEKLKKPILLGTTKSEAQIYIDSETELLSMNEEILQQLFGLNSSVVGRAFRRACHVQSPREAAIRVLSDYLYILATQRLADKFTSHASPVWMYRFDWEGPHGACHIQDVPFVWNHGTETDGVFCVPDNSKFLAHRIHKAWVAFVHHGDPGIPELPYWPPYTLSNREAMSFAHTCRVIPIPKIKGASPMPDEVYAT